MQHRAEKEYRMPQKEKIVNLAQQMHHFAIVVADLDESLRWYKEKLGFTLEKRFGFPEVGTEIAHIVSESGLRLEVMSRAGSVSGPDVDRDAFAALLTQGAKHIGFLVADVDATAQELKRRGITLVHEPTTVPPAGVRNCWIRDNTGTLIEFVQVLD